MNNLSLKTKEFNSNPSIYVASLSHYNNGELVGRWFDLEDYQDGEHLLKSISSYIYGLTCYSEQCEEWAIHDFDNLPFRIDEYASTETFNKLYQAVELSKTYDMEAITAFVACFSQDELEVFEDCYQGNYESELDFTHEYIENNYDLDKMMGSLSCYFDYDSYSNDLFINSFTYHNGYIFSRY